MNAVPWLPVDVRPPAALDALFAAPVADWASHWFVGEVPRAPAFERRGGGGFWRQDHAGLAIGRDDDTAMRVGARIVGVAAEGRGGADRALLERVAEPCLTDLRARLDAVAGGGAGFPVAQGPRWVATLGDGLLLGLSDALFATLVRRVLPPVALPPLRPGAQALAAIPIRIGAAVGRAAMSVGELRALEVGDVVVLDRPLAEPVAIMANGHPLPRGRVRVVPADPTPALHIVDAAA